MSAPRLALYVSVSAFAVASAWSQSLLHTDTGKLGLDDAEITPDRHYAVVRQNDVDEYVLIYDLTTGAQVGTVPTGGELCGDLLDAVGVTNTRAIVLGGSRVTILDLTQAGTPQVVLATHEVGSRPNDVAVTPDGRLAAVRGGSPNGTSSGGLFLYDLQTGAQVGASPGLPPVYTYFGTPNYSYDTDSVAVTNRHAVMLSIVGQFTPSARTHVTIWDLNPGGSPFVAFQTSAAQDLLGAPHDVSISPDGTHAAVRSEFGIAGFDLSGATPALLWSTTPFQSADGFDDRALDSVEATDTRVVTISRHVTAPSTEGAQIDFVEWSGLQRYDRVAGSPHDFAVTPDGTRVVLRTKAGVYLYDMLHFAATTQQSPAGFVATPSSTTGYEDGLDSVAANDAFAVTLVHAANVLDTEAWFWSISRGQLRLLAKNVIGFSRPTDVTITPDGRRALVTGNSSVSAFHLATGGLTFQHAPVGPNAFYQWCDGIVARDDKAVGIGQWGPQQGWIDVIDMTPVATSSCTANVNSTGRAAEIGAQGRASVSANSLKLFVENVPAGARGRFVYGSAATQIPFGDGVQCVATPAYGLRFQTANPAGAAFYRVDFNAPAVPTALITPGSTWRFQFVFVDEHSAGFGVNTSNAVAITFTP